MRTGHVTIGNGPSPPLPSMGKHPHFCCPQEREDFGGGRLECPGFRKAGSFSIICVRTALSVDHLWKIVNPLMGSRATQPALLLTPIGHSGRPPGAPVWPLLRDGETQLGEACQGHGRSSWIHSSASLESLHPPLPGLPSDRLSPSQPSPGWPPARGSRGGLPRPPP